MTDRVSHLPVALTDDIRTDDVEAIVTAISMIRNVAGVELGISDPSTFIARLRVRQEVREKLYDVIKSLG